MQQIRNNHQNNKTLKCECLYICCQIVVTHVRQIWNTLWPSLIAMDKRLEELGVMCEGVEYSTASLVYTNSRNQRGPP
jgi:hypothetical protein